MKLNHARTLVLFLILWFSASGLAWAQWGRIGGTGYNNFSAASGSKDSGGFMDSLKQMFSSDPDQPSQAADTGNEKGSDSRDIALNSPFGIFGPYEYRLGSTARVSVQEVNQYLVDLGVKWVQEMPLNLSQLPDGVNVYSRIGREGGFVPPAQNYDRYQSELQTFVRNMPSVLYVEVDTEPSGRRPPMGWSGYHREYSRFLKETYTIVKEARPDCKVVIGGVPGVGKLRKQGNRQLNFLRQLLEDGAADYFDVFSFKQHHHAAADYQEIKARLDAFQEMFSEYGIDLLKEKEIFIEVGSYSGRPYYPPRHPLSFLNLPEQDERVHASNLIKTYVFSLAHGVDKIFWNQIVELHNFGGFPSNPFNYYGLVNNPLNDDGLSHKKLAYFAYKKMVEILEGSDWESINIIREKDWLNIYEFSRQGRHVWVAWTDIKGQRNFEISDISGNQVKVTPGFPDKASGRNLEWGADLFQSTLVDAEKGKASLTIGDVPLFIEEM